MVNTHIQEGWIDHDLKILTRRDPKTNADKEYAVGALTWITGSKEKRQRHKITLFFEDTAQHLMLTAARSMKLKEHSHVIITGTLRVPAEEKQEDGTWKVSQKPALNVENISFAPSGPAKTEKKGTEENENFAPTGLSDDEGGYEEEAINIGDGSDLPF